MSITEDAPVRQQPRRSPVRLPGRARRASPWWWLVVVSTVVLVGAIAVMGIWWAATSERREVSYRVIGTLSAIELDLDTANVEVAGGEAGPIQVVRTEEFAFDHPPEDRHTVQNGVLRISSRCPDTVVGTCRASYRILVRDNVQLNIRSSSGGVRVSGLNGSARIETASGPIVVDGFCGFQLTATSASGAVRGAADCSPDRMELRSASGDVHAIVPTGRYRVDASSDRGSARVSNLVVTDDASFAVQAISGSGDVLVDGRR
jgi:Putative adhesin